MANLSHKIYALSYVLTLLWGKNMALRRQPKAVILRLSRVSGHEYEVNGFGSNGTSFVL